jgi:hypothetical protein
MFNLNQDPDLTEALALMVQSTAITAKALLPDRFERPYSRLHQEIFRILDDDSITQAVIAAPRGWGKTTTVNIAYPIKKIVFREKKFIVPISCTATQAVLNAENMKRELLSNYEIIKLFGDMKSDNFSKDQWETSSGTMVLPRGAGQQVRGVLYGRYRPDLILLDDVEDPESVRNEELRKKLKAWFFEDVVNSIDRPAKNYKILMIGTILHEDGLLANLLDDPDWYSLRLELCDNDYKSNWPEFMSDKEIFSLVESYRAKGMLDSFYREYRNLPIATEDATFRQEYFKYYEETEEILGKNRNIENVVIVDPAKTVKLHSNDSAIVGIGIDRISGKLYFRECISARLYPDQLYKETFDMMDRLKANVLGIEVTSLNEFITFPLKNAMLMRGKFYEIIELKARAKKEDRISALVPFYRKGLVFHNKNISGGLEAQLLSFPRAKKDDITDAFAYIVEMLELGDRFFAPTQQDSVDEFADLVYEPPLQQNWKVLN